MPEQFKITGTSITFPDSAEIIFSVDDEDVIIDDGDKIRILIGSWKDITKIVDDLIKGSMK